MSLDRRSVNAIWHTADAEPDILSWVARRAGIEPVDLLGADLMTHDVTPSRIIGAEQDLLLSAPRA